MTDWFKLAGNYYRDPKVLRAGESAEVLFVRGLSYCCEHGTHGRIPGAALPYLVAGDAEARAASLVRVGLWATDGDEYVVSAWDSWQEGVDALTERRRKDRERKRAERASKRNVRGQSADTSAEVRATEKEIEKEETSKDVSSARTRTAPQRLDVEQLCNRLAAAMVRNGCRKPTVTDRWRDAARLLLDRDGIPIDEALRVLDWCQDDEFWRANIQSLPKFREKFDRLRMHASRPTAAASQQPSRNALILQREYERAEAAERNLA